MNVVKPVSGSAVWYGSEQSRKHDWIIHVNAEQINELERATDAVRSSGLRLDDAARSDFFLLTLALMLETARLELEWGRGFYCSRRGHGEKTTEWRVPVYAPGQNGMDFRPGDIQFLNNRLIFHARTDYQPDPPVTRYCGSVE